MFLEDSADQLESLDRNLVRLEKEQDDEILQEIFRAAHTLKGSSATIGHTRMAELTHAMESVLDEVRKRTLQVSAPVIDRLLEGLDALRVLTDEVEQLQSSGLDVGPLVASLQALLASEPAPAEAAGAATSEGAPGGGLRLEGELLASAEERKARGLHVLQVSVRLDEGCEMPAVRMLQCLMTLGATGEVLGSEPSEAEVEAGEVGSALRVALASERDASEVRGLVTSVPEVAAVECTALIEEGAEEEQEAVPEPAGPQPGGTGTVPVPIEKKAPQAKFVRIDVARLDKLMNLSGELIIGRGRLAALGPGMVASGANQELVEALSEIAAHLGRTSSELQNEIMQSRMLPMEHVVNRFPRMVRDLARKEGKEVDFRITGQETELDRSVIEEIGDPLMHLLRNAMDHGLESPEERVAAGKARVGVVELSTTHEENTIVIRVRDDGRGIDPARTKAKAGEVGLLPPETLTRLSDQEAIELIWEPGFSTAKKVTDVSGRGVGMDIVRTNIGKLNGRVSVQSVLGQGSTFEVRVPLTLAVIEGLVVRVGASVVVVPISSVTESLNVQDAEIRTVRGEQVLQVRGAVLPLINLVELWRRGDESNGGGLSTPRDVTAEGDDGRSTEQYVVAVQVGDQRAGLIVDELLGEQEVVIKSLGTLLRRVRGVSGAAVLGDDVALIVDVPNVLQLHQEKQRAA